MIYKALIVFILTTTTLAHASEMRPVEMTHTPSGNAVVIACYDIPAQMGNADAGDRYLLIGMRKTAWQSADRAAIRRAIRRLLDRTDRLTPAKRQALRDTFADAGAFVIRTTDPGAALAARNIESAGETP